MSENVQINIFSERDYLSLEKLDYYTKISLDSIWQEWIQVCKEQHYTGNTCQSEDTYYTYISN